MKKFWMIGLCCLLLTACASQKDSNTTPTQTIPGTSSVTTAPMETETTVTEFVKFTVYIPNEALDGYIEVEAEAEDLSVQLIVQKLVEVNVLNEDVAANSMIIEDGQLRIDFTTAFYDQLVSMGSTGERFFMGSVVNTFLSAYNAECAFITVNGEVIESGHVVYDFPMEFFK